MTTGRFPIDAVRLLAHQARAGDDAYCRSCAAMMQADERIYMVPSADARGNSNGGLSGLYCAGCIETRDESDGSFGNRNIEQQIAKLLTGLLEGKRERLGVDVSRPLSVKLESTAKGYRPTIHYYGDTVDECVEVIAEADRVLRRRFRIEGDAPAGEGGK